MGLRHLYGIPLALLLTIAMSQAVGATTATEWNDEGHALYYQGRYAEAIEAYDEAIALEPTDGHLWYDLGNVLRKQGSYSAAFDAYDRAIALDPAGAGHWTDKGVVLYNQGNYSEAIEAYDTAIALDPTDARATEDRALALAALQEAPAPASSSPTVLPVPTTAPGTTRAAEGPVPLLVALAIGAIGLARVRRRGRQ